MSALRPRIGKEQMKHRHRARREEVLDRVQNIHSQNPRVGGRKLSDFPRRAAPSSGQSFYSDEITLRMRGRERRQESAVAASEIDFDRSGATEDFGKIERRENAFRHHF